MRKKKPPLLKEPATHAALLMNPMIMESASSVKKSPPRRKHLSSLNGNQIKKLPPPLKSTKKVLPKKKSTSQLGQLTLKNLKKGANKKSLKEVKNFEKVFGDRATAKWHKDMCPTGCGCRLRFDGSLIWCSYIKCDWYDDFKNYCTEKGDTP